ncbi:MAG: alanine/glycine:cation symporter family protein [Bacteroidetes bacterium]|nr:alanine/glycine:cation symporter family protein [Bacteroidota bacterium]
MKKILLFIFSFIPLFSFAQEKSTLQQINDAIVNTFTPVADTVTYYFFYEMQFGKFSIPIILIWLVLGALFCTVYMKFVNVRGFKHAINIVRGKYDFPGKKKDGTEVTGQVSHFQALTAALSGTIGLGNITGVAVAISIGGPGATFWMIVAGILGMSSKFVECTLGVKYRNENANGTVSGGPMYYLSKGFSKRGMAGLGKILAVIFAIMCIGGSLSGGNMFQVNQARVQFQSLSGIFGSFWQTEDGALLFGVIIAILTGVVIIGGIKSIARVTDKLVPFMCALYVVSALIILAFFYDKIPSAFKLIFNGALDFDAGIGGAIGAMIQGFKRAAFSNEAGIGSAAIAHSAVKTDEPVTEGLVSLLEPFIDTVVICTMTALVLVITGTYNHQGVEGVEMTAEAFHSVFGYLGNIILTIAVLLFAFATMITWSYYGLKSWGYIFGENKYMKNLYKVIFCCFVVVGSVLSLDNLVGLSDALIFAMAIPNMIGLYVMAPEIKRDLTDFLARIKSGEIKPYK